MSIPSTHLGTSSSMIACPHCDLVQEAPRLPPQQRARCSHCHCVMYRGHSGRFERSLALAFTAAVLFAIANLAPFLALEVSGRVQEMTLISASWMLWVNDQWPVAIMVAATSVVVPLLEIVGLIAVLLPLVSQRMNNPSASTYRRVLKLRNWAMLEVYLISVLVALVKLKDMASVIVGPAFYAFVALIVVLAATFVSIEPRSIWEHSVWKDQ